MEHPLDHDMLKQIGHEARRPLVSLINTADLLLTGLEGEVPPQVRDDVEAMKQNAQDALVTIDGLLILLGTTAASTKSAV